jgi:hypothetical protein
VYLPKYSITCLGEPKGRLAYTTHSLLNNEFSKCLSAIPALRKSETYLALNILLMAFTENKNLPLPFIARQFLSASKPPPGTMQFTPLEIYPTG